MSFKIEIPPKTIEQLQETIDDLEQEKFKYEDLYFQTLKTVEPLNDHITRLKNHKIKLKKTVQFLAYNLMKQVEKRRRPINDTESED